MYDYQRSSGHVVTRRGSTGRSTVPYRCTIDVRTHIRSPTAAPRAFWRPLGTRRAPGGTVGPRLLGASPVWAPQLLLASADATGRIPERLHSTHQWLRRCAHNTVERSGCAFYLVTTVEVWTSQCWTPMHQPLVRARQGPVWVRISVVHQYGTVERSIRACRVISGSDGFPSEP